MSWPTVKLGDVCEIVSGATPSTSVKENWGSDYFWATPKDLSSLNAQTISKTDRKISAQGLRSCSANLLPVNSVLFSSRAPIGLVAINTVPIATNQGFKSLIPNINCLDAKYLYFWLKKNKKNIDTMGVGATFKEVSKAIVARIEIPLPPLAQQKRIAAILDKADAIKRKREQAIAKLDQLAQSIFVEMFGDIESNSKKLSKVTLKDVCLRVTDGTHQSPKWQSDGVPFLFISNIVNGEIVLKTNKYISNTTYDELTNRCRIEVGDVLYTTVGTYGNVAIVRTTEKFCFQRHIAHIKPDQNIVNSVFLSAMLYSNCVKRQADRIAKGIAQKTVNLGDICKFIIFCPSIALQEQFATRISKLEKLKASNIAALEKHNQLFASLQNQAFTGQL